ncbi:MAG: alpha/beta hydrolase [Muribaculaceae bacterium]|nr:alpha/beta hydrolase [Muribaculaceae bacterium]
MKRYIVILLNLLIGISVAFSQTETWSGDLEIQGTKLPLVFHLDGDNPTLDSPAQGAKGIPIVFVQTESDSLYVSIPTIGASFTGKYQKDKVTGIFKQRGIELPLILKPGYKMSHRPQTPQPPYPYSQEEVSFTNGDAALKGTLTLPEKYNKETPVLIMITGSGLQNRDEELFEHKPFAVIADALARNGIASLRYDDRGLGESTGDVINCTTEDLMKDALSGINLLRQRFNKVGVLGHSEGGTIAFMLGADNKTDFIISLAGMVISGAETLMEQNRWFLTQAGYPQATVDEYCNLLSAAFQGDNDFPNKLEKSALPIELKQNMQAGMAQLKSPYMQYFLALDMRDKLGNVACPVLALNGTKDTQVFYKDNLKALNERLPSNGHNKVISLEGLNHLFQHCSTGSVNEYGTIEETISPEVLEIISQWIKSL